MRVGPYEAGQAAELLGIDLYDLMTALHDKSVLTFTIEARRADDWESPNFGRARRLLRAAQACADAYDTESAATTETAEA